MDTLLSLGTEQVHELARKANGTVTTYRLVSGRCLLTLHENKGYREFGCSGATHYGVAILGMSAGVARDSKRVANELQILPQLTLAAELGQIDWSKLREIVRVASPDTEKLWLALAATKNARQIQKLVKLTPWGGLPGDADDATSLTTELRCKASPEQIETFNRVRRMLSLEHEKALTGAETLEYLLAAFLSSQPVDAKVLEKVRDDADKDLMAEKARCLPEVFEVRELARTLAEGELGGGSSEEVETDELLAQALGGATVESHCCRGDCCDSHESKQLTSSVSQFESAYFARLVNHLKSQYESARTRFGPDNRHTTKAQKRESFRRDGWCCSTPGCCCSVWLEIHHIKPYSEGGKTVKENLLGLCSGCHRNLHQGFLKIIPQADGTLVFTDAQGRRLDRQADLELAGWLDQFQGWSGGEFDSHYARLHQGEWAVFS